MRYLLIRKDSNLSLTYACINLFKIDTDNIAKFFDGLLKNINLYNKENKKYRRTRDFTILNNLDNNKVINRIYVLDAYGVWDVKKGNYIR